MVDLDSLSLTPEQKEKVKELKTREDFMKFVEEQDLALTDEQLDAISGGSDYWDDFNDQFKSD